MWPIRYCSFHNIHSSYGYIRLRDVFTDAYKKTRNVSNNCYTIWRSLENQYFLLCYKYMTNHHWFKNNRISWLLSVQRSNTERETISSVVWGWLIFKKYDFRPKIFKPTYFWSRYLYSVWTVSAKVFQRPSTHIYDDLLVINCACALKIGFPVGVLRFLSINSSRSCTDFKYNNIETTVSYIRSTHKTAMFHHVIAFK